MIGLPFGSQVWSQDRRRQLHILRPSPELWTRVLPHRTQILYMPDIAFIIEMLEIQKGSIVIESGSEIIWEQADLLGTGSGSFSHSIARAVGQGGRLYTFDFHEERAKQAVIEFEEHGLSDVVTVACRDVCNAGFGLDGIANAVFLDLPSPWLAIEHAKTSLRRERATRVACFSPCMEQVQRTLLELMKCGFCELEMYEVVLRPLEVDEIDLISTKNQSIGQKRSLENRIYAAKSPTDIKGHTSYLYFATLLSTQQ